MATFGVDTIVAQATPCGRGGVGILRISGALVTEIAVRVLGKVPAPRVATYGAFLQESAVIDQGIALYFPAPHSFTGEEVLELHAHGGQIVLDSLLQHILTLGARLAHPGEFSQRAFLNNKMDLIQAEAIADLIDASSVQAARSAVRSLQGEFSNLIRKLVTEVTELRVHIETAIDFGAEELTFLTEAQVAMRLQQLCETIQAIKQSAQQGVVLRDGVTIAIIGKPNVGKSSLLNRLSEQELAIVTEVPGTTRDILRAYIHIDGIPIHLLDTAGLHNTTDVIEKEGIKRAQQALQEADAVLLIVDATVEERSIPEILDEYPKATQTLVVFNKMDLAPQRSVVGGHAISAKTGLGIAELKQHIKALAGYSSLEGNLGARRRHIDAIKRAEVLLLQATDNLAQVSLECVAEDLRLVQHTLGEITGDVTNETLLAQIFAQFCIGK